MKPEAVGDFVAEAQIRFATDILRRLGEELNPSIDQGIIELVKNAYDADARRCTVELTNTDRPGGTIRVTDDGVGMTLDDIVEGWLVLGRSTKSARRRTALGRIPAGSKGLGRLAALRLGSKALLVTRPSDEPRKEFRLDIDWNEYEHAKVIDDVGLDINVHSRKSKSPEGSEIVLTGIRRRIGRMDVKRLARAMILLADPFGNDPKGFEPDLRTSEFRDLEKLVQNRYLTEAEYHLIAEVHSDGRAQAEVRDWRDQLLYEATHHDLTAHRDLQPYNCPPAKYDLWIFLLSSQSFALRQSSISEVRDWLDSFGGVHLYLNGLRVAPYGNPGNDWLDMNLRRARTPEERPSTNTSIGRLAVTDIEETLVQKTDRSGLIEDEEFLQLESFAQDAMEWLARRRLQAAEQRRQRERQRAPKRSETTRRNIEASLQTVPRAARTALERDFQRYDRDREREVTALRKEVQLYRTLSTAGITAATFAHESSGNPLKIIVQSIRAIERRGREHLGEKYEAALAKPVAFIIRATESLSVLSTATLRLVAHEKRRVGRVNVHNVIEGVLTTFAPFFDGRDVVVSTEFVRANPYLRGTEAALESIITNLLNNSLAAFERADVTQRQIVVETDLVEDAVIIRVLDNGPGIMDISKKDIWLPGQTTKNNGTGLGLTIVKDAATDLGGRVAAVEHGPLGGAEFIVELPILGA